MNRKGTTLWVAAALVAAIGITGIGLAQDRRPPRHRWTPEEEQEVRETMLALMSLKMKRALELDQDQERDIMPLLDELMEMRGNGRREQERQNVQLRRLVQDPDSSDGDIESMLAEIRDNHRDMERRQKQVRDEIDSFLTPRQEAKMIFFEARFRREMEQKFREMRRMERGRGRRPGGDVPEQP